MQNEVEIKLGVAGFAQPAVEDALIARLGKPDTRMLHNRYFDTPDRALWHQRMAVRLREKAGQWQMTLKGKGGQAGGLHRRQEWEWPVQSPDLDVERLVATGMLDAETVAHLAPVFDTDFERKIWYVTGEDLHAEVALDSGWICAGEKREPLCELEVELMSGSAQALVAWAQAWCAVWPVWPMTASKAQRGYELASGELSGRGGMVRRAEVALEGWSRWCTDHLLTASSRQAAWALLAREGREQARDLVDALGLNSSPARWHEDDWEQGMGTLCADILKHMVTSGT